MNDRTLDIRTVLETAGVDMETAKPDNTDRAPQFFEYILVTGERIQVESTAKTVMAVLVCLPVRIQRRIFSAFVAMLTRPGEQVIITDEKRRGARVVRLASEDENVHRLLLTH